MAGTLSDGIGGGRMITMVVAGDALAAEQVTETAPQPLQRCLLYEFDVLAGSSELHDELVQKL